MSELLGEVVTAIVGDALGETLFPARNETPPAEGEWNASLGTISIFLSGMAATFALAGCLAIINSDHSTGVSGWATLLVIVCGGVSFAALRMARHTFRVTARRLFLARVAIAISTTTIALSSLVLLWGLFR